MDQYDVVIVGAGAAGVGCGVLLRDLGIAEFAILERHDVGASFDAWPAEMRFITPSFPSNGFGLMDLNAVALGTSPAFTCNVEHPSGQQYATYLRAVATHWQLPVHAGVDVQRVERTSAGFAVHTSHGTLHTQFIIWAAGEYQYPRVAPFPGAEHATHTSTVRTWQALDGNDFLIIGGYESGMDAAVQLAGLGKRARVLDAADTWDTGSGDPSLALSPYTRERMLAAIKQNALKLHFGTSVNRIEPTATGYAVIAEDGARFETAHPPLLATGFVGSHTMLGDLFELRDNGTAILTANDESTIAPGLFLAGPLVRHPGAIFCFIYKFRQRFAVIGQQIAQRLELDLEPLEMYRKSNMFLEDLSCCDDTCVC